MKKQILNKPFPSFKTDEEVEHFVDTADLSEYDFSSLTPVHFEFDFQIEDKRSPILLPDKLSDELFEKAKEAGVPYQKFVALTLENALK